MAPETTPGTDPASSNNGTSTCLKVGAIGCGVLLLLFLVGGYIIYTRGESMARSMIASQVQLAAEMGLAEVGLPEADRTAVMKPVHAFVNSIREGHVSMNQGMQVVNQLLDTRMLAVFGTRVFLQRHIQEASLPGEERDAAIQTVRRYAHGLAEGLIPESSIESVMNVVTRKIVDAEGREQIRFKASLTPEERNAALALMQAAVNDAGIPNAVRDVDLSTLVEDAIREGMEEGAKLDTTAPQSPRRSG